MAIVGIDLGTPNSLIGLIQGGRPRLFTGEDGSPLVPSVVTFDEKDIPTVGSPARAKKTTHATRTLYSVKRFMGKGLSDVSAWVNSLPFDFSKSNEQMIRWTIGHRTYTPIELSALILQKLKSLAETELREKVEKAVITVPAYFNDSQRQATKFAGELAGLEVIRIVNEPTAACLAYGLDKKAKGTVAVFDLGGGTFDISILRVKEGIFEVLATHGDTALGGDDFDHAIASRLRDEIIRSTGRDPSLLANDRAKLVVEAERLKIELSNSNEAVYQTTIDGKTFERKITRKDLEDWIQPILGRTQYPCLQCLKDAGVDPNHLSDVILVGGSTRMPAVRNLVRAIFKRDPICTLNPDEVVAIGAAVQANVLAGQMEGLLLLDVIPLSLGIETIGGVTSRIIRRNSTVPISASETFSTYVDGQISVDIHVVQGERELAKDNRSLARFQLKGLPPLPAGAPKIEVEFIVDANGILNVRAMEVRTNTAAAITVNPSYGLNHVEIETMLSQAYEHAESDFAKRFLVEARTEGESLVRAARKSLERGGHLIHAHEKKTIEEALQSLESHLSSDDYKQIRTKIEKLNSTSQHLAEVLLNDAISQTLKGKTIETT